MPWYFISVVFLISGNEVIERTIDIILIGSLLLSISGLIESFTSFNVFSLIENMTYDNPRFGSIQTFRWDYVRIEQAYNTSLTYALVQFFCLGLAFYRYLTNKKLPLIILMLLQYVNIILTLTRGVTLISSVGILILIYLNRKELGVKRLFFVAFAGLIVIFYLLTNEKFSEMLGNTFSSAFSILFTGSGGIYDDSSVSMRENFQSVAFEALKNPRNLIFGVGEYSIRDMISIDNEWLLEITGYGLIGLAGFLVLISFPILKSLNMLRITTDAKGKSFYTSMLVTSCIYAVSLYTVAQMAEARLFYVVWGIIVSYRINEQGK